MPLPSRSGPHCSVCGAAAPRGGRRNSRFIRIPDRSPGKQKTGKAAHQCEKPRQAFISKSVPSMASPLRMTRALAS